MFNYDSVVGIFMCVRCMDIASITFYRGKDVKEGR